MSAGYFSFGGGGHLNFIFKKKNVLHQFEPSLKGEMIFLWAPKQKQNCPDSFSKKCHTYLQNTRIIFPGENI